MDADAATFAGKYIVGRVLGRGGMGTVFEARHARLGHRVAIKVLATKLCHHSELVKRFDREARAAGALTSPHAVRVFDIDQTPDGRPYIVMELLSGCDLARVLEFEGEQPIGRAVRWIIEACGAIAEAHRLGIIHRDIKPSNLMLLENGSIKVLDFGIAKHVTSKDARITLGPSPLGTPHYMSPEQVRCAHDVDERTDIWSLGITLYELLCGRPPFDQAAAEACIAAVAADPVPDPRKFRPELPDALVDVLFKALAKAPNDRFQTVEQLVLALEPFVETRAAMDAELARVIATARPTLGRDGDATIPPVLRASATNRMRSSLLLGSTALVALTALLATPRCVSTSPKPAAVVATPLANAGPPPAPTTRIEIGPATEPDQQAPEPPVASARPTPEPRRVAPKPAPRPPPARAALIADRPVHGGISSPGF